MPTYTVLRDLSRPGTSGPFDATGRFDVAEARLEPFSPSEPRIDVAELSKAEVRDMARDPSVRGLAPIMPTRLIQPEETDQPGEPAAGQVPWGITAVGADRSTRTGAGVVVSVLDTGIDATHAAFAGVTLVQEDFSESGNGDKQGHGTHCAGTIFGREVNNTRIGVAPGVSTALIGKVLGDDGSGNSDMIFKGIQWAIANGAQVISMSLGFDFPGFVQRRTDQGWPASLATSAALEAYRANLRMFDALMKMIDSRDAFGAGTVVTAAAGNESKRDTSPDFEIAVSLPAAAEGILSVGAAKESANGLIIAPFSNTFPEITAPGVNVVSARAGGGLRSLSGTSMATPHVAGVAALWWEQVLNSPLPQRARTVVAKLAATASIEPFAADVDIADRGLGIVQAP